MKILNIIDMNFIKIYLTKYYISNDVDYTFFVPTKENIMSLHKIDEEFHPNIILIQDKYKDFSGIEIIKYLKFFKIKCQIGYISFSNSEKEIEKLKNELGDLEDLENLKIIYTQEDKFLNNLEKTIIEVNGGKTLTNFPSSERRKILYVDDSKFMHNVIIDIIPKNEFQLIHAYDGKEALVLYNEILPDLIISDIEMPEMNGIELCKTIKENNKDRFIPIIMLSSLNNPFDIETAFNCGADDYLIKPVDADKLMQKVYEYTSDVVRKGSHKVYIVDNSKMVSELMRHALLKNGINTSSVNNAFEALKLIEEDIPEVIIVDCSIKEISIESFVEVVRNIPALSDVGIIIIGDKKKIKEIRTGGIIKATKYFITPFDIGRLVIAVENLIIEKYNGYKKEVEYMLITIKSLIKALEARDQYTKGHSERVSELSVSLGEKIGMDRQSLYELEIAANLHDIGKIGIRDEVLLKKDKLTQEEYALIQQHAVIGAEILKPIKALEKIIPIVLFHHESWDGKGYPSMLRGDKIPLGSRILAVADSYDAITTNRPYRKRKTEREALKIIEENVGIQFCPEIAIPFIEMMDERLKKLENK